MAEIPQALTDEITAGNCAAFVGAGFSAPGELTQFSWAREGKHAE